MGDKTCTPIRTKGTSLCKGDCRTQTPPISNRTTLGGFCGAIEGCSEGLKYYGIRPCKKARLRRMLEGGWCLEGN